jgi:hypothetical protein
LHHIPLKHIANRIKQTREEQLVIRLHQEGKTIREIASAAHLSFGDIGTITRRADGHDKAGDIETKGLNDKSPDTKVLWLFANGKKPIDVAIELDLSASEMHEMQEEFWALNQLHELV